MSESLREYRNRRFANALLVLVFILMGYAAYWMYISHKATTLLEEWRAGTRETEVKFDWKHLTVSGFPTTVAVVIHEPSAISRNGAHWQTPGIVLSMSVWNWTNIHFDASHPHAFKTFDARHYDFNFDTLEGIFSYHSESDFTLNTQFTNAVTTFEDQPSSTILAGDIRINHVPGDDAGSEALTRFIWFSLSGIQSPKLEQLPLGGVIDSLSGEIETFTNPPHGPDRDALTAWHEKGGAVNFRSLRLNYGPLLLHSEGTIALDQALQPVGAFTTKIQGFRKAVDALHAIGTLDNAAAFTTRLMLGALAKEDEATGESVLELPLSVQDRIVTMGPLTLGTLPVIHWDE